MLEVIQNIWSNHLMLSSPGDEETGAAWEQCFTDLGLKISKTFPQDEARFQEGEFIWKVSLGPVWRRIKIHSEVDLDEFAFAITSAFEFEFDHLYQFEGRDRRGRRLEFVHPALDSESPTTEETRIGELPITIGDSLTFWFDFGDDWKFKVLLESIDAGSKKVKAPKMIEKKGKAPQQYPHYSDEW